MLLIDLDIASSLIGFAMDNPHADLNDCVDFVCEAFDMDCTDSLIDAVHDFMVECDAEEVLA